MIVREVKWMKGSHLLHPECRIRSNGWICLLVRNRCMHGINKRRRRKKEEEGEM